ncbi:interleukin-7 isoform X2 [Eublepharis macularius]|uniref:Interleukin-7 n=1 Tax=Eublepharis macularius TaxID=481883 RepID=A0AA97L349_EUBMA|nr:interleukin-7 isoform X2 [Eublepharis macularius]
MFHAFLRYVFGIQPLFLVLMPVASSACEKKDMQPAYMFVLRHHLEQLVNESENHGHECRQNNTKELICNTAQNIHNMACQLNRLSTCNITTHLKNNMTNVYNHISSLFKCPGHNTKGRLTNKSSSDILLLCTPFA